MIVTLTLDDRSSSTLTAVMQKLNTDDPSLTVLHMLDAYNKALERHNTNTANK